MTPATITLRPQQTLAASAEVFGFGFWSGRDIRLEFRPAEPNTGIVFVRTDTVVPLHIPAKVRNRIEQPRRTTLVRRDLVSGETAVEMVEHVLAALAALQVDNAEVWCDSAEMPGCDGSSLAFVEAIDRVGVVTQDAVRPQLRVTEPLRVGDANAWVEAKPCQNETYSVRYELDYGPGPIGQQDYQTDVTPDTFRSELAAARTFVLEAEARYLHDQGLGHRVTARDIIVFDDHGPVDNHLRFDDECPRHKALDIVGDLALAGCDLVGEFTGFQSGHRLNAALVAELLKAETIIDRKAA